MHLHVLTRPNYNVFEITLKIFSQKFPKGISTMLCILPLALINKYSPTVFVYAVIFVCSLGLLHGLVFLPCLLCNLPIWCNSQQNYFFGFFSNFGKFQVYELDMITIEERKEQRN
ncbi:unnamed protein product [Meloidogyne enterolobii]|uniref:Uncharacterized protein n=1 Tax=Meloidogyne enterolobii TaxID=390850 RepID=A0ACB0YF38_MELEN